LGIKNVYLNSVLNVRFLSTNNTQNKEHQKKIIIIKIKKYKDKEKRIHTLVKSQPPKKEISSI